MNEQTKPFLNKNGFYFMPNIKIPLLRYQALKEIFAGILRQMREIIDIVYFDISVPVDHQFRDGRLVYLERQKPDHVAIDNAGDDRFYKVPMAGHNYLLAYVLLPKVGDYAAGLGLELIELLIHLLISGQVLFPSFFRHVEIADPIPIFPVDLVQPLIAYYPFL